ncbi:hypothetical protein M5K25_024760 [Dendrobium thyrsiflorum]|uniref:Bulb-type lectin domain-containing protein n=1 Tax=Dendrobium thyrsiflorum TaxID=117978 RepID=A0ABD0U344_DENTH
MAPFLNIIPLCIFLLIVLISASGSTAETNVLLTGQTLSHQAKLSYADTGVSLVMQHDCNLVTYNGQGTPTWHTNTAGKGYRECILSFTDNGRLVVRNPNGGQMWISSNANSKVSIIGPAVWSTSGIESNISSEIVPSIKNLKNSPIVYNILFSGQVLYNNGKLSDNGYSFIMKDDCELALENCNGLVSWSTWTKGNGQNCFARLSYKGELAVRADDYEPVWSSWASEEAPVGEYVLLMQQNGEAVIYGPEVWTNKHDKSGFIKMPISEK